MNVIEKQSNQAFDLLVVDQVAIIICYCIVIGYNYFIHAYSSKQIVV